MTGRPLILKYGTPKHDKVKRAILDRQSMSEKTMSWRHTAWKEADEVYRCYAKETDEATRLKAQRAKGKKVYVDLVVPYSYAVLLTCHTYWSSVFLSRSPIMQFAGRHGESEDQVQALEALVDYQVQVGGMLVPLYIWLLDAGRYGMGVLGNYWADEKARVTKIVDVEEPVKFMGIPVPGKTKKRTERQTITIPGYSGNKVYNIRPQDFYPDPRVSLVNLQNGEFCGRITHVGWNTILARRFDEVSGEGDYFNLEELEKALHQGGQDAAVSLTTTDQLPPTSDSTMALDNFGSKGYVDLIEQVVELCPRDWELGVSPLPEKWVFTLAHRSVVIGARPLGAVHNQFPFFVNTYEIEGYNHGLRGLLEITKPLNDALEWLLNQHFYNVRTALNNQFVVDPTRVQMSDLMDGGPGKIIRIKPEFTGTDVRTVLSQLPVQDLTRTHLADMQIIEDLIQRVTGAPDAVQGMARPGGRKTATEIRTASSFGVNRLKTFCEYNSALGWSRLAQVLVQNTQQLYDEPKQFKIVGDLMKRAKYRPIAPEDILGFYDFVPVDGTMPIDRFAQATLWKELLMGMVKVPQLAGGFDLAGIFSWMAQLAGLKNIDQFRVSVQPDAQVLGGGAIPAQQMMAQLAAGGSSPSAGGAAPSAQTSGMETALQGLTQGTQGGE